MKNLELKTRMAQEMLVQAIMDYVREHGEDYTNEPLPSYYYNEFGIDDEEDGCKVTKLLNLFDNGGCYFAIQERVNDDDVETYWEGGDYKDAAWCCFHYHAYWAFYIVRDADGEERLKYYQFDNQGLIFDDDGSEPDHDYVDGMSLAELNYIIEAISEYDKK